MRWIDTPYFRSISSKCSKVATYSSPVLKNTKSVFSPAPHRKSRSTITSLSPPPAARAHDVSVLLHHLKASGKSISNHKVIRGRNDDAIQSHLITTKILFYCSTNCCIYCFDIFAAFSVNPFFLISGN